jgi:hypothetical protein
VVRLYYLVRIAKAAENGQVRNLLNYAQGLARAYVKGGIQGADRFAGITRIPPYPVTGRAYSWMTDQDCYHPGGRFVKIPDRLNGSLGGNRFFTLQKMD